MEPPDIHSKSSTLELETRIGLNFKEISRSPTSRRYNNSYPCIVDLLAGINDINCRYVSYDTDAVKRSSGIRQKADELFHRLGPDLWPNDDVDGWEFFCVSPPWLLPPHDLNNEPVNRFHTQYQHRLYYSDAVDRAFLAKGFYDLICFKVLRYHWNHGRNLPLPSERFEPLDSECLPNSEASQSSDSDLSECETDGDSDYLVTQPKSGCSKTTPRTTAPHNMSTYRPPTAQMMGNSQAKLAAINKAMEESSQRPAIAQSHLYTSKGRLTEQSATQAASPFPISHAPPARQSPGVWSMSRQSSELSDNHPKRPGDESIHVADPKKRKLTLKVPLLRPSLIVKLKLMREKPPQGPRSTRDASTEQMGHSRATGSSTPRERSANPAKSPQPSKATEGHALESESQLNMRGTAVQGSVGLAPKDAAIDRMNRRLQLDQGADAATVERTLREKEREEEEEEEDEQNLLSSLPQIHRAASSNTVPSNGSNGRTASADCGLKRSQQSINAKYDWMEEQAEAVSFERFRESLQRRDDLSDEQKQETLRLAAVIFKAQPLVVDQIRQSAGYTQSPVGARQQPESVSTRENDSGVDGSGSREQRGRSPSISARPAGASPTPIVEATTGSDIGTTASANDSAKDQRGPTAKEAALSFENGASATLVPGATASNPSTETTTGTSVETTASAERSASDLCEPVSQRATSSKDECTDAPAHCKLLSASATERVDATAVGKPVLASSSTNRVDTPGPLEGRSDHAIPSIPVTQTTATSTIQTQDASNDAHIFQDIMVFLRIKRNSHPEPTNVYAVSLGDVSSQGGDFWEAMQAEPGMQLDTGEKIVQVDVRCTDDSPAVSRNLTDFKMLKASGRDRSWGLLLKRLRGSYEKKGTIVELDLEATVHVRRESDVKVAE